MNMSRFYGNFVAYSFLSKERRNKNMAKPKNKIFCRDCNRPKILFETEKKAELFIKYNADEIAEHNRKGKKPIRSYYCQLCGGWHVTSSPVSDSKRYTLTDKVLSLYYGDAK